MICAMGVLTMYVPTTPKSAQKEGSGRSLLAIAKQPNFQLALAAAVAAWSIMSLLMTATPVAMHEVDGFNMQDTAFVIQSHIMAMFLPSLVTGVLIDRYGAPLMIAVGAAILGACLVIGFIDHQLIHYWWALVLLGVGWNFMQLGGTALLTTTYEPSEQFKVQAFNDFTVFTLQAVAALSSGYLLLSLGWHFLIYQRAATRATFALFGNPPATACATCRWGYLMESQVNHAPTRFTESSFLLRGQASYFLFIRFIASVEIMQTMRLKWVTIPTENRLFLHQTSLCSAS